MTRCAYVSVFREHRVITRHRKYAWQDMNTALYCFVLFLRGRGEALRQALGGGGGGGRGRMNGVFFVDFFLGGGKCEDGGQLK